MLDGRAATLERIYLDYDDRVHLAVTVDDDPGQELMRETGRYLFFKPTRCSRYDRHPDATGIDAAPQILVAGIGNAWLRDDGFGARWSRR